MWPLNKTATFLVLLLTLASCGKPQEEGEIAFSVPRTALGAEAGTQFIKVTSYTSWTITLSEAWASVSQAEGSGSVSGIELSWEENLGDERNCTVTLASGGKKFNATLVQERNSTQLVPDTPAAWLELPATTDKDLYYFTHDMTLGGRKVRNYSFYLDPQAKLSKWVAYPLNKTLKGSGSRTDEWGLDPKVPKAYQPILYSGFAGGYQRGHQLPSADRLTKGVNETTFYFTNMTPQSGELNEKVWATLEGMVRNWSAKTDTLYVVTGADWRGATQYARDNVGAQIPVPVGYYKALLAYKASGFGDEGKYLGIAFWFDHKGYENSTATVMGQAMSIDALEEKLGIDFFVNLPAAAGKAQADKVEAEVNNWWK